MEMMKLNDGNKIPAIGFGVFMIPNDGSMYNAVKKALAAGYRHIDTATAYFNEEEVGKAIKDSGIPRAMEETKAEGKLRSIGVSNMTLKIWNEFVPQFATKPVVNQIEFNPFYQQKAIRKIMDQDDVKVEAWYPLGHGDASLLSNPIITELAKKYGKNPGQICIRFEVQEGVITLPKSTNLDVFDFSFTDDEMAALRSLDTGKGQHDPDANGVGEMLLNAFQVED